MRRFCIFVFFSFFALTLSSQVAVSTQARLADARQLLLSGKADNLLALIDNLHDLVEDGNTSAIRLQYISSEVIRQVYPAYTDMLPRRIVQNRAYRSYFDTAFTGNIPSMDNEDKDFACIVRALSLFYTNDVNRYTVIYDEMTEFYEQYPASVYGPLFMGIIMYKIQEFEAASEHLNEALRNDSNSYTASRYLLAILLHEERFSAAAQLIRTYLEDIHGDHTLDILAARAYKETGNLFDALNRISTALLSFRSAEYYLENVDILIRLKRFNDAQHILSANRALLRNYIQTYIFQAEIHMQKNAILAALDSLIYAYEAFPANIKVKTDLANILFITGQARRAVRLLKEALKLTEDKQKLYKTIIQYYIDIEDYSTAIAYLTEAIDFLDEKTVLLLQTSIFSETEEYLAHKDAAALLYKQYYSNEHLLLYIDALKLSNEDSTLHTLVQEELRQAQTPAMYSKLLYELSRFERNDEQKLRHLESAITYNIKNRDALLALAMFKHDYKQDDKARHYLIMLLNFYPHDEEALILYQESFN